MHDEWGLVMKGQNVENVNKDVDLCEVEVNDMPFHTSWTRMGRTSFLDHYNGASLQHGWLSQVDGLSSTPWFTLWFRPRGFDIKTWGKLNLFRGQNGFVIMGCSWGNIMLSLCDTLWHPKLSFRASWWCPKATLWHCPTFSLRTTLVLFWDITWCCLLGTWMT